MCRLRAEKVARIADDIPHQELDGPDSGDLLVLSWGGPYGACATAVHQAQAAGKKVSHCQLRYINPFPKNLAEIFTRFKKILVPELNLGQLSLILRAEFLLDIVSLNKVTGKPFNVAEILTKIDELS